MDDAVKSSLLWGLIGALSFLVLVQGYQLLAGEFVGFGALIGVTTAVGAVSAAATHALRPRVRALQRARD